jgi:predicted MFS family arabinose efflux permease
VWRSRAIRAVLGFSLIQATAQAIFIVYIAPQLQAALGAGPSHIALLLAWTGAVGFIGTFIGMRFIDRVGALRMGRVSLACCSVSMLLWPLAHWLPVALFALALWGISSGLVFTTVQAHLVKMDMRLAPLSVPFNTTMNFAGGTAGAVLGGVLVSYVGSAALSWGALALFAIAIARSFALERRGG